MELGNACLAALRLPRVLGPLVDELADELADEIDESVSPAVRARGRPRAGRHGPEAVQVRLDAGRFRRVPRCRDHRRPPPGVKMICAPQAPLTDPEAGF
ncbi:hypothetical protein [Streptomyces sp. NPDC058751]|uniref:hypothetical protein n=1 Tax=Streptomyces sp. NPDC058751 TaxID=3346623 RepID=UPI0036A4AFCC